MIKKVLVIIPTYNESDSIVLLLNRINKIIQELKNSYETDVVMVDGNSSDETRELAYSLRLKNLKIIHQIQKNGIGPAYKEGFEFGLKGDYSLFVQMDADLSHQPEELAKLLAASSTKKLVIGTRWMEGGSVINWPRHRRFVSKLGTRYASILLGLANRDLTSGFRVLPKELLEKLDLSTIQSIGYGFQIELALNAVRAGFEIEEVPITFIERENGESKMSLGIVFEAWKVVTAEGFKRVIVRR